MKKKKRKTKKPRRPQEYYINDSAQGKLLKIVDGKTIEVGPALKVRPQIVLYDD